MNHAAEPRRGYALVLVLVLALVLLSGTALLVWWSGLQARSARALRYRLAAVHRAAYLAARVAYLHNLPTAGPRHLDRSQQWIPGTDGRQIYRDPAQLFPKTATAERRFRLTLWRRPHEQNAPNLRIHWSFQRGQTIIRGHIDLTSLPLTVFDLALGPETRGRLRVQVLPRSTRWAWLAPALDLDPNPPPVGEVWTLPQAVLPGPLSSLRRRMTPEWPPLSRWFDWGPWHDAAQQNHVCGSGRGLYLVPGAPTTAFFRAFTADRDTLTIDLNDLDVCHPQGFHYRGRPLPGPQRGFNGILWSEVPLRLTGTLHGPCLGRGQPVTLWVLAPGPDRLELQAPLGAVRDPHGLPQRVVVLQVGPTHLTASDGDEIRADLFLDGPVTFATPVMVRGSVYLNGPLSGQSVLALARSRALEPATPASACRIRHWLYRPRLVVADFVSP